MKRAYKTIVDLIPDAQHFAATVLLGELESWGAIIGQMGVEAAVDAIIASSEREAAPTGGLWPCTDEWVPDFRARVRSTLVDRLTDARARRMSARLANVPMMGMSIVHGVLADTDTVILQESRRLR